MGINTTTIRMKMIKHVIATAMTISALALPLAGIAGDNAAKPKPDFLTNCPVSGDKLGEMGTPFVFEYKGQEVKLCCKSCKKDFDKNPAKYMKIIRAADKDSK
jgi:YHS domain-containing protein